MTAEEHDTAGERAAGERERAAARLRGAAEALHVLQRRSPVDQRRAAQFAVNMLAANVAQANWAQAGLPAPASSVRDAEHLVPLSHRAAVSLARVVLGLYRTQLRVNDRPVHWDMLEAFFARHLPADHPELVRLRERAANAHVDADDTSREVFDMLTDALSYHAEHDGHDAYLTSLARANLSVAYRQRRAGSDLAEATRLAREEVKTRTMRYGPDHPVTLVARSMLTLSLLLQAEASDDEAERRHLAQSALAEVGKVRVARDRLFGVTSPNATSTRRYEARALLLLGQTERARSCLESTLSFENTHNAGQQAQSLGSTHYQLARVHLALGDRARAADHARHAREIFESHNPAGRSAREVRRLLEGLAPGPTGGPGGA